MTRRQGLALALLLALGGWLRIHAIASHALWIDEYGTWWAVAGSGYGELFQRVQAVQGQSPLYYALVRATVDLLGTSALSLRLPSLLCGLALLALAYPLGLRIFASPRGALFSVAAFAVSERLIYYSQEARPYGLALLLSCLSLLLYVDLLRGGGRRAAVGHALATAGAFYAHYLFGVVAAVQGLHLLLRGLATRRRHGTAGARPPHTSVALRPWALRAAALGVLCAPGLAWLLGLGGRRQELDWVPVAEGPATALALGASLLDPALLAVLGGAVLVAAAAGGGPVRPPPQAVPGLALLWLALPLLALDALTRAAGVNLVDLRYATAAVPAAALMHALLLCLAPARGPLRTLPGVAFLAVALGVRLLGHASEQGTFSQRIVDHRWADAMTALAADHREGDLVLYRTRYVELDAVVMGTASPEVQSFVSWPLLAHWPEGRELLRVALPYGRTLEVRRQALAILDDALASPRVWLVGHPHVTRVLVNEVERRPDVEVLRRERHGQVLLVLLARRSDAAKP